MDNVSSIKFHYNIIRKSIFKTNNIFQYAAFMQIIYKNNVFLTIEDICIIDFIYKLTSYNENLDIYEFIPIDATDKVLIIKKVNSNSIEITSDWTENKIFMKQEEFINAVNSLKHDIESELKININTYFGKK